MKVGITREKSNECKFKDLIPKENFIDLADKDVMEPDIYIKIKNNEDNYNCVQLDNGKIYKNEQNDSVIRVKACDFDKDDDCIIFKFEEK